jgi:hypothetical protein
VDAATTSKSEKKPNGKRRSRNDSDFSDNNNSSDNASDMETIDYYKLRADSKQLASQRSEPFFFIFSYTLAINAVSRPSSSRYLKRKII